MIEIKPKVFCYARASTKKQVDSPETQKDIMARYVAYNLSDADDPVYFVDSSISGAVPLLEREAGKEMFARLRPGDHLVFAKLDRAFRRLSDCVTILDRMERMGIKIHVCNLMGGALDLGSPMGRFMIHILAAFAELERSFISERTKEGLKGKKRRGFAHSRFPGYGFRWSKRWVDGKLESVRVRDDDERNVMRSILMWRMQDAPLSWDEIRQHLTYKLHIRTKDGKWWDENRCRRACKAELELQLLEQRARS